MTDEERRKYYRDKMRAWRAANPDKVRAASKKYYDNNKAKCAARAKDWNARHPSYATKQSRKWRAANPDKIKCHSLRRVGFTLALRDQMLEQQNGRCAICAVEFSSLKQMHMHADHCHQTGRPRGVLCKNCNTGLGAYKDDPDLLRAAAVYLEKEEQHA